MSVDEVYMDVPAVTDMAQGLQTISEVLQNVCKVLEGLITTLNVTAFIGLVGGAALARYLDWLKPQIEELAEKFAEMSKDVTASIEAYQRGDDLGAARFH